MNNFESDPEEFAKTFCKDLGIEDPEVAVSSSHHIALISIQTNKVFRFFCISHVRFMVNTKLKFFFSPTSRYVPSASKDKMALAC